MPSVVRILGDGVRRLKLRHDTLVVLVDFCLVAFYSSEFIPDSLNAETSCQFILTAVSLTLIITFTNLGLRLRP